MYFIYALTDPRTDAVAYVGITDNAYERFRKHMHDRSANGRKHAWIQQLKEEKVMPAMKILETVANREMAIEREEYWIHHYLEQGVQLINLQLYPLMHKKRERAEKQKEVNKLQREETCAFGKQTNEKKRSLPNGIKQSYYTAGEAIAKLGIPQNMFYYLIKQGELPEGVKTPLRRQALYRKASIDRLAEEKAEYLNKLNKN